MNMKNLLTIFLAVIFFAANVAAFDGEREGIIFGGGAGFAPLADWHIKGFSTMGENKPGIALCLFAGYAFDESFMVVFQKEGVIHTIESVDGENQSVLQGFTGGVIYYYFGDVGSSFFLTSGIGVQNYSVFDGINLSHTSDFGFQVGGGYELREHLQIYGSFTYGKTKTTFEFEHNQFMLMLSLVAF